jgi:hypothetical protein
MWYGILQLQHIFLWTATQDLSHSGATQLPQLPSSTQQHTAALLHSDEALEGTRTFADIAPPQTSHKKRRQVPCVHHEQCPQLQHWDCHTTSMMWPEWCSIALQGGCHDWRWSSSTFHPHIPASCTAAGPYLMRLVPGMVNTSSP